jgi:DNA-binding transcriptional ArsR family regulator
MSSQPTLTIQVDRRLLEHPRAYHLRRMRAGIWLYLDLLARLPAGAETFEVEPAAIGRDMGLPEGTIRSWLGHLRKAGYVKAERLNGKVRVTMKRNAVPEPPPGPVAAPARFFTVAKLQRTLGEPGNEESLQAALNLNSDAVVKRALAGTLAVPETQIRRSRTALFIYLLKRHAKES